MSTDKDWEKWGSKDPYFGVYSDERFRRRSLDQSSKSAFFATGAAHIDRVFRLVQQHFSLDLMPAKSLDFGCGVGRLLIPLASRSGYSLGVDVSPSMLEEAKENTVSAEINNVSFALSDDELKSVVGHFNFVHSYIVFQHIPWKRGRIIIQQLAGKVEDGGVLAVHVLTATRHSNISRVLARLRYQLPPIQYLWNLIKRRSIFEPPMQLHVYNMENIIDDLNDLGFDSPVLCSEPDMDGFENVYILARRNFHSGPA